MALGVGSELRMARIEVCVSGVHSDPDPSPGIGIARSLREAFPDANLHAVDYSVRSSGIHHPVFDSVLLQPAWSELDLETYSSQIRQHLKQSTSCWLSGLDVETAWLAETIGEHPRLLGPSEAAQQAVRKPTIACARSLQMRTPKFLPALSSPAELHALGRDCGWNLWVKGKFHEAYSAHSFAELRHRVKTLEAHWPLEDIFVQQHVSGLEESIAFAAYKGRLLDAVHVEKRIVTSLGKTWAAAVTAAPADVVERLGSFIAEVSWTGGGEVEFVRDSMGEDWLIDFNPRFPAYIYGITLCGHNLPACVVGAALGIEFALQRDPVRQFTRIVQELPVRDEFPIPRIVPTADGFASTGKHPSFQPALVRRLWRPEQHGSPTPERSSPVLPEFLADWQAPLKTPLRFRDFSPTDASLDRLAKALDRCSARPRVIPALSVKTDPHPTLARAFEMRGWWAEIISLRELDWAHQMGFEASKIVFNGPAAVDLTSTHGRPVAVAFADSVEALEALLESQPCEVIGLRLRSAAVTSRFGVDLRDSRAFQRVADCLRRHDTGLRLGLHMHFASDVCGLARWNDLVEHALVWADALAQASGAAFSVFDFGGGWNPDDFRDQLIPMLPALQARIAQAMPCVDTVLFEPGKAVAADSAWLATRVLEVRSSELDGSSEVVVDASISDLPMAIFDAHRVLHLRDGLCLGWLTGGSQRILGSICMEADILAEGIAFPQPPAIGDVFLFSSAGGYNASMAWHFASGVSRDT